jgi:hypothetical protein
MTGSFHSEGGDPDARLVLWKKCAPTSRLRGLARARAWCRVRFPTRASPGPVRARPCYHRRMERDSSEIERALRALIGEYRARCLWFLRPDWYPSTPDERVRALDYIEQHGDTEAFRRARLLRRWLSPNSNAASAG